METRQFYDDLAPYYDLIFENWDASMSRQGAVLEHLIQSELGAEGSGAPPRILDAACGIGTQALPLALRGFRVTARDLSPGAIARLRREAEVREVVIDADVADMRFVAANVSGPFDVVLAFDNSIPHLTSDSDISVALREFRKILRPGGLCLLSVRDYDTVPRGVTTMHPYGEHRRGNEVFRLRQEWTWEGSMHYQIAFIVEKLGSNGPETLMRTVTRYYALSIQRLLELMTGVGFTGCRRLDETIYQPIVIGHVV
ncbi:MAG TPA: class I SAM-dependent methyltransferase [Gammaproteobacteria bacterium]|nr:class I SAM-dependent methyltransferase [Gammaproteobacteria bacterium]